MAKAWQTHCRLTPSPQVNLALAARQHLKDGGSITLTTGILSEEPILYGSSASMVNGAVEGFVVHAATELPRGKL